MIIIDSNGQKYNIELKTNGENAMPCPICSQDRKKKNAKSFSFNLDKGIGYCHHCGMKFSKEYKKEKHYIRPEWNNRTDLSDKIVKWFETRKISQFTLKEMKITGTTAIEFNYFRGDELITIKYREAGKKFRMFKDGEMIFYNFNALSSEEIIIVEGEMDCLSYIEAGIRNVVSVPNGSSVGEFLDSSMNYFEDKTKIFIAVDQDHPGFLLKKELIRRFGAERCFDVDFEDCKDANEFLVKYGKERLRDTIKNAKEIPIDGVFEVEKFRDELDLLYEKGLQRGMTLGYREFDELISFETGRLCIITGTPSSGKSEFLDQILEILNIKYKIKFGIFSPENYPLELHASKLIEKFTGKQFKEGKLEQELYNKSIDHVNNNFFFIKPTDENYSLDNIIMKARGLVNKRGIMGLVIDPWNRLEYQIPAGMSETNFVSMAMTRLLNFAQKFNVIVFLVAHPRKIGKTQAGTYEVPTLYDISGSAHFFNKTDYGIVVYRHFGADLQSNITDVYIQKVKFKHLGHIGKVKFRYNINNGRFVEVEDETDNPKWDNENHFYGIPGKAKEPEKIPF